MPLTNGYASWKKGENKQRIVDFGRWLKIKSHLRVALRWLRQKTVHPYSPAEALAVSAAERMACTMLL